MEKPESYTCHYCKKEFVPKRRRVQKFCSDSCRSGHWQLRNRKDVTPTAFEKEITETLTEIKSEIIEPTKIDKVSLAGVGNSALGTAIYDLGKGIVKLTQMEKNKLATRGDVWKVVSHLERYQPINDFPNNEYGQRPYFDMETKTIVYRGMENPFLDN